MITKHKSVSSEVRKTLIVPESFIVVDKDLNAVHLGDGVTPGGISVSRPISLIGPAAVREGTSVEYQISNHDRFSVYRAGSTLTGSLEIVEGRIQYTAPVASTDELRVFRNNIGQSYTIQIEPIEIQGMWTQLAGGPPARYSHRSFYADGKLYVFGGLADTVLGDLWCYDPIEDVWTECSSGPARYEHTMVGINGKLYVFGGLNTSGQVLNDLWRYDPTDDSWTSLTVGPSARRLSTAAALGDKMYIFGGVGGTGSSPRLNDLWCYDPSDDSWTQCSSGPVARFAHGMTAMDGNLYVFGGYAGSNVKDLWRYNVDSDSWSELSNPGSVTGRQRFDLIAAGGKLYFFGGVGSPGTTYLGDMWVYDTETDSWSEVPQVNAPSPRCGYSSAVLNERIYLFGGSSGNVLDELWICE